MPTLRSTLLLLVGLVASSHMRAQDSLVYSTLKSMDINCDSCLTGLDSAFCAWQDFVDTRNGLLLEIGHSDDSISMQQELSHWIQEKHKECRIEPGTPGRSERKLYRYYSCMAERIEGYQLEDSE